MPEWQTKYQGWWPGTPYLEIPEDKRRAAQPEFDPTKLQQIEALELVPTEPIPPEAFEVFQTSIALGEPPIYEHQTPTE